MQNKSAESKIGHIIKRDSSIVPFTKTRVVNAIYRAAIAVGGRDNKLAEKLANKVTTALVERFGSKDIHVEEVQDMIEKVLIDNGKAQTAKAFILYRAERKRERENRESLKDSEYGGSTVPWKKTWESLNWSYEHGIMTVKDLNRRIEESSYLELIRESENAYNMEISRAAEILIKRSSSARMVIIAGPSSSGKTTSTIKIAEHLKNEGFVFVPLHVDNYFFDLHLHPRDEHGDFDYETPEAIDMELLNSDLNKIIAGEEVHPPFFNFKTGKREGHAEPVLLKPGEILLFDSHHGMHPAVTEGIPDELKLSVYTEPLLQMRGPEGAYIKWTDIRLMRRLFRDRRDRGQAPIDTVKHWRYVRRAELRHIIPASIRADVIINTALPYALPIWSYLLGDLFSSWAESGQSDFSGHTHAFERVKRLDYLFKNIKKWKDVSVIPEDTLLREFVGSSPEPVVNG
ncbi:MAG: response regulator SirA [Elusimicrobia bacterium]|nr:response regulator SirA [Elusimicrobiota bacterium]